ncbi:MAG TPA: mycofactocin precursor MftA [Acidimicrobiales bacterium]|nr:mycofactocin precursor MftA [Acidimicrobiales bacterium]
MPEQLLTPALEAAADTTAEDETDPVEDELLVEEISIDGMCGVY